MDHGQTIIVKQNILLDKEFIMDVFDATMIAEGVDEVETQEEMIEAWQVLIDTGTCWSLQGWFGRTATQLIEQGHCKAA